MLRGREPGKRKRVTRKADGKLTEADAFGEFRGVLARKADAFGYPFQLTHFSLPISGPLNMCIIHVEHVYTLYISLSLCI